MRGFTLSELLIASGILAIVLVGLLVVFINCIFLNEANRNLTIAITHMQFTMEEIKNTNFNSIISNYNGACWDNATLVSKGLTPLISENICMNVTGTDVLDVAVLASWKDRALRDRTATLETLIAEP